MNPIVESSFLLWLLALLVAVLGAQVSLGWIRHGQRDPPWQRSWRSTLLAGATLGSTITGATLLALAAEGVPFLLGFRTISTLGIWFGAVVASLPLAALLVHSRTWLSLTAAGTALAVLAALVQFGWIWAAGFRPGIVWQDEFIVGATLLMALAFVWALRIAYSDAGNEGERRKVLRIGAATLMGVALVVGAEVVKAGAGLMSQVSSDYRRQMTAAVLSLFFGVGLPLLMLVLSLDLHLRTRAHRRKRRRKRKTLVVSVAASACASAAPAPTPPSPAAPPAASPDPAVGP